MGIVFNQNALWLMDEQKHPVNRLSGKKALMGIRPEHIQIGHPKDGFTLAGKVRIVEPWDMR